MKFVYFSSLFMAFALSAGAQGIYQFEDPGFEDQNWKTEKISAPVIGGTCYEPEKDWHSFLSAEGSLKTMRALSPQPQHIEAGYKGYAVKLVSAEAGAFSINEEANGNLTTGRVYMGSRTPESSDNYNYSDIDGGQCLQFAGIPDAVEFYAKFKPGSKNVADDNKDKPAGRAQFILHDRYAYRDPEIKADIESHRIAFASQLIYESDDWVLYGKVPFVYSETKDPKVEKYLLASITTNPTPGQSVGDELCIDEIHFIYNSELESLTYGEKNITSISEGQTIDLTGMEYDESTLDKGLVLTGKGAYTEKSYDKKTGLLTLTVKGNDWEVNNANQHVYEVQFTPVPPAASEVVDTYTRLVKVRLGSENAEAVSSINNINLSESSDQLGTVDFTMNNFAFGGSSMGDVVVKGAELSYGEGDDIKITTSKPQRITLCPEGASEDEYITADVSLDATVSSTKDLTAKVTIQWVVSEVPIMNIWAEVGAIPFNITLEGKTLKVTGSVAADEAAAVIPTDKDVNVVDLKGATLTGNITSSAFEAKNPNTLFYAAEGAPLTGNNVVKGTECDNFVLTDGQSFNAPEGFTANQITYKRVTVASTDKDEVYTFVLPFTFTADKVNGTVYKLTGVNDGVLDFTSLEGSMELKANRPYLVVSNGNQLLNTAAFSGDVLATDNLTNETIGGVAMVGAYEATPVTSDGNENWYGYNAKGEFVKATSGTINPFRAAIKSTGIAPSSYALKLDGTVTGILNLENPNAKVDVYTISGVCVRKNVPAASALNGLSRGVYIVGGQKVVK